MKLLSILLFAIISFSGYALATPVSSFAESNSNNNSNHSNDKRDKDEDDDKGDKDKDEEKNVCKKHPEKPQCQVSVPEFGAIPGVIALITSGGTFFYFKRRYN